MFIYNHEPIYRLRDSSLLDFEPFGSIYEEFYEVVWCVDKETAIKLNIERWHQKWKNMQKEQTPLIFFPKLEFDERDGGCTIC